MQFNLANYINILKKNSRCPSYSDEEFVAELFDPFVVAYDLKNKKKAPFRLDKHQVSKLLNQESDVPSKLRKIVNATQDLSSVYDGFEVFVDSIMGKDFLEINLEHIGELISKDPLVSDEVKERLEAEKADAIKYLFDAYIEALKINNANPKVEDTSIWSRGNSSLKVISANLMTKAFPRSWNIAQDIIIVIPVNTTFETALAQIGSGDPPLVSENTIHGKWLKTLYGKRIPKEHIDRVIIKSLNSQGLTPIHKSKSPFGKQDAYKTGTVAVYRHNKSVFYLWAISESDEWNKTQSTDNIIKQALESLIDFYDVYGQGADLYIPLVGTGRSRANMTHQESYELIKETVIANSSKIHGNVNIVVLPSEYEKIKVF